MGTRAPRHEDSRQHSATAPQRLAIFGGRGGGAIVAEYAEAAGAVVLGVLNDDLGKGGQVNGRAALGTFADWRRLPADVRFLAPLHKVKEMQARARLIRRLGIPEARWAIVVDPRAVVAADVVIGAGSHIGPGAEIHPGTRIGRHVGVRGGARISHDCTIGDFVFFGLNAVVCGYVRVGEGSHVAPQAAVCENVTIGRHAVVGLGAVVIDDVEDYAIVAGNPARRVGTVPAEHGNPE